MKRQRKEGRGWIDRAEKGKGQGKEEGAYYIEWILDNIIIVEYD